MVYINVFEYIWTMNDSEGIIDTIKSFEETLLRYQIELRKYPESIFYKGLIKNTGEYIEELKNKKKNND